MAERRQRLPRTELKDKEAPAAAEAKQADVLVSEIDADSKDIEAAYNEIKTSEGKLGAANKAVEKKVYEALDRVYGFYNKWKDRPEDLERFYEDRGVAKVAGRANPFTRIVKATFRDEWDTREAKTDAEKKAKAARRTKVSKYATLLDFVDREQPKEGAEKFLSQHGSMNDAITKARNAKKNEAPEADDATKAEAREKGLARLRAQAGQTLPKGEPGSTALALVFYDEDGKARFFDVDDETMRKALERYLEATGAAKSGKRGRPLGAFGFLDEIRRIADSFYRDEDRAKKQKFAPKVVLVAIGKEGVKVFFGRRIDANVVSAPVAQWETDLLPWMSYGPMVLSGDDLLAIKKAKASSTVATIFSSQRALIRAYNDTAPEPVADESKKPRKSDIIAESKFEKEHLDSQGYDFYEFQHKINGAVPALAPSNDDTFYRLEPEQYIIWREVDSLEQKDDRYVVRVNGSDIEFWDANKTTKMQSISVGDGLPNGFEYVMKKKDVARFDRVIRFKDDKPVEVRVALRSRTLVFSADHKSGLLTVSIPSLNPAGNREIGDLEAVAPSVFTQFRDDVFERVKKGKIAATALQEAYVVPQNAERDDTLAEPSSFLDASKIG